MRSRAPAPAARPGWTRPTARSPRSARPPPLRRPSRAPVRGRPRPHRAAVLHEQLLAGAQACEGRTRRLILTIGGVDRAVEPASRSAFLDALDRLHERFLVGVDGVTEV